VVRNSSSNEEIIGVVGESKESERTGGGGTLGDTENGYCWLEDVG